MAASVRHVRLNHRKNMFFVLALILHLSSSVLCIDKTIDRQKRAAIDPQQGNIPQGGQGNLVRGAGQQQNFVPGAGQGFAQGAGQQAFAPAGAAFNQVPANNMLPVNAQVNPMLMQQKNFNKESQGMLKTARKGSQIMLADAPECAEELAKCHIQLGSKRHNFAILECVQNTPEIQISEACQHLIYQYKVNLTKDGRFMSAGKEVCKKALTTYSECSLEKQENRIPCLIEYMDNITEPSCHQFLTKMAGIIFSDYRYVYHFMENCEADIATHKCGRVDNTEDEKFQKQHEQGKTIICLASHIGKLDSKCRKQVLRVAELQSDDYHLDRQLFYACRDARELFCEKVHAGGGKVFECLFKHKSDVTMPIECKRMLTIRQQLIAEDVKVEKTFYTACKKDMKDQGCMTSIEGDDSEAKRSAVLLCLENALVKDKMLAPMCIEEMTQLRKSLMEDYKVTPDIVARCDHEINMFCHGGLERGGKTLHCLMRIANPRKVKKGEELSPECKGALENLLVEANVGENYKVDKVLREACAETLEHECKSSQGKRVINCLMENVDAETMTDECEDRLLEIQYFLVRDFRLDPQLYKECHADAKNMCHASDNWHTSDVQGASNDPLVFPCLYRTLKDNPSDLSRSCVHEIKRVMRRRAKRIDLEPAIEDKCLQDLGAFCSDLSTYGKGKEIACLQDHLDDLDDDCSEAVRDFTEDEGQDLDLDTALMKACTPMIKEFCGELLDHEAEASDVMTCLIQNKHHHRMDKKCAAGIEHHQIIQLKDVRFSHKFRENCKDDIQNLCADPTMKTKTAIVTCLSDIVRMDVLSNKKEHKMRVSEKCRSQLRVEVLRRGETIELDPELKDKCTQDINSYCNSIENGNAKVIQCLKDNKPKLSNECHKLIFKRQQEEAVMGADYLLFRVCKPMIKTHCKTIDDATDVIDCLKRNRNVDQFDTKCRALLMKKILQETKDYRLNPSLAKNCRLDIPKFCSNIVDKHKQERKDDDEFEGAVVNCLKLQFTKKLLSRDCSSEIRTLVVESHLDIDMDPVLKQKCSSEIKNYCGDEIKEIEEHREGKLQFQPASTGDKIEECLQNKLKDHKIPQESPCGREVTRVIEENHVDVNIDVQLRAACEKDLVRWCQDVDTGEGRKMSCLLGALEDFPNKLTVYCKNMLSQRLALWEYAAKPAPAESIGDLADNVMQSPAKSYLLAVLMTVVGVIFIVGISCGRVTKRVAAETKNK